MHFCILKQGEPIDTLSLPRESPGFLFFLECHFARFHRSFASPTVQPVIYRLDSLLRAVKLRVARNELIQHRDRRGDIVRYRAETVLRFSFRTIRKGSVDYKNVIIAVVKNLSHSVRCGKYQFSIFSSLDRGVMLHTGAYVRISVYCLL